MNDSTPFPGWQTRTALLLGNEKLEKLRNAHVLVIGLGGVGGIAAEMICRAGVGSMTIADGDLIEESNRNRQIAALTSTVGKPKAELLGARLLDINPELRLTILNEYLRDDRMFEVLGAYKHEVVVADFLDTVPDDPLHAGSILHEIEFIFPVLVQRVSEFCLMAVHNVETVFFRQRGNFFKDVAHRSVFMWLMFSSKIQKTHQKRYFFIKFLI